MELLFENVLRWNCFLKMCWDQFATFFCAEISSPLFFCAEISSPIFFVLRSVRHFFFVLRFAGAVRHICILCWDIPFSCICAEIYRFSLRLCWDWPFCAEMRHLSTNLLLLSTNFTRAWLRCRKKVICAEISEEASQHKFASSQHKFTNFTRA